MERPAPATVLVIEDDPDALANVRDILELDDHHVDTASTAAEALRQRDWSRYAAIILDRKLPDARFEDLLPTLRRLAPEAPLIIVTGYADLSGAISALRDGAADYILKPLDPDALRASLGRVLERRALRLARDRSEATFRLLVEAAECLILIIRPNFEVLYFSPFAERLTGYAADEVTGHDVLKLLVPESDHQTAAEAIARAYDGEPARSLEVPLRGRDGRLRWIVWNVHRIDDYEGGPALLSVGHDITNVKEAQDRALQSERLAAIGQMVAGLAHESRNALQRSQSCLEMLTWKVQDRPEALDLIRRIQAAQDHLHHLYEDVRTYAAPIKLERGRYDLAQVWREAWNDLEPIRRSRVATLREAIACEETRCWLDPFRLIQVFRNILENALAACADPVEIRVRCLADELEGRPALRVAIHDNGTGFTPDQKLHIFEPFFTTKTRGTGLGMAITKRIIEAHGGRIAVGSSQEPGAEILLTLPRGPA